MESTEAMTSGQVREAQKFRPQVGAEGWQGTSLKGPGLPLLGGLGEQGTGRVLVTNNISGQQQGVRGGAIRNTEQNTGIGHVVKGTEREQIHFLKGANQVSNVAH